jgi:rubredoxin
MHPVYGDFTTDTHARQRACGRIPCYPAGMQKYICTNCGYIYDPVKGDPERGFAPPCSFESLPDDWTCPICYVSKDRFDPL